MNRFQLARKIAILGIVSNVLLLVIKLIVGFFSRSQSMIADGFNSAGDVFASSMTFIGNKIASKPEDHNHPFGHGKAEYIFSMIISFSLLIVAFKIFTNSLESILKKAQFSFSWWLIGTAVITIVLKLSLFIYTYKIGKREYNLLVLANAEDHRNDVFVTSSVLVGIISGIYGVYWLDGIVGIGISLWITYTGFRIFKSAYIVLMDTSINNELKEEVTKVVESIDGVDHVDDVASKPIGIRFIIIVKVSVKGDMTVVQGHSIAAQIKQKLCQKKNIGDVVVHVNPA